MKKNLLIGFLAIATLLVGCKQKETPTEVTAIVLDKTELALKVGDAAVKLTATTEPAGSAVTWSTSNEQVATVLGGLVSPVAEGECVITAKAGEKTATCKVTVATPSEEVEFDFVPGGWGIFGITVPEGADTVTINFTSGDSAECVLADARLLIWGEGIVYNEGLKGNDYIYDCPAHVYYIVTGPDAGYYVGAANGFEWVDTVAHGAVIPGSFTDDYAEAVMGVLNAEDSISDEEKEAIYSRWDNCMSGSIGMVYNNGWYYPYVGVIPAGRVDDNYDTKEYYFDIYFDWFEFSEKAQYGIKGEAVYDAAGEFVDFNFAQPYEVSLQRQHYKNYDFAEAPAGKTLYKKINPAHIHQESVLSALKHRDTRTLSIKK